MSGFDLISEAAEEARVDYCEALEARNELLDARKALAERLRAAKDSATYPRPEVVIALAAAVNALPVAEEALAERSGKLDSANAFAERLEEEQRAKQLEAAW